MCSRYSVRFGVCVCVYGAAHTYFPHGDDGGETCARSARARRCRRRRCRTQAKCVCDCVYYWQTVTRSHTGQCVCVRVSSKCVPSSPSSSSNACNRKVCVCVSCMSVFSSSHSFRVCTRSHNYHLPSRLSQPYHITQTPYATHSTFVRVYLSVCV